MRLSREVAAGWNLGECSLFGSLDWLLLAQAYMYYNLPGMIHMHLAAEWST